MLKTICFGHEILLKLTLDVSKWIIVTNGEDAARRLQGHDLGASEFASRVPNQLSHVSRLSLRSVQVPIVVVQLSPIPVTIHDGATIDLVWQVSLEIMEILTVWQIGIVLEIFFHVARHLDGSLQRRLCELVIDDYQLTEIC